MDGRTLMLSITMAIVAASASKESNGFMAIARERAISDHHATGRQHAVAHTDNLAKHEESQAWWPSLKKFFKSESSFSRQRLSSEEALGLYQCLHLVNGIFARRNITYWAGGGTLLGALRNKGLIPHDDDIDIHIPEDDFAKMKKDPELLADLELNGLVLFPKARGQVGITNKSEGGGPSGGLRSLVQKGPSYWIDVFAMSLEDDKWKFTSQGWTDPRRNYFFKDRWFVGNVTREPFEHIPFGSTTVAIPSQTLSLAYLDKLYGADWNTTAACRRSFHSCHMGEDKRWAVSHHAEPDGPLWDAQFA